MFPRFSRVQATVFIGGCRVAFIFVGRFAFNLVQSISTFAVLIVTCTAPWMVVMMSASSPAAAGTTPTRCRCSTAASAAAGTGSPTAGTGAACRPGWSPRRSACCFVNIPGQFVGPLGNLAGGVDICLPVGLGLAAVLYLALLWLFPEPRAVHGPRGPFLTRAVEAPVTPITGER